MHRIPCNFTLDVDNKDLYVSFNKVFRISKMIQINNYLTVATEVNNKKANLIDKYRINTVNTL